MKPADLDLHFFYADYESTFTLKLYQKIDWKLEVQIVKTIQWHTIQFVLKGACVLIGLNIIQLFHACL